MSFLSALKAIGHAVGIGVQAADKVEQNPLVQSLESTFIPAKVVTVIAGALHAVAGAETVAAGAAATSTMSGEQKMAVALSAFNQVYTNYAVSVGAPVEPANVQAFLQKAFELLDTLPSGVQAPPATPATPAAA